MNPSAFYLVSAIFGLNILFISCSNPPQPGQGQHIMDLPESIVDMLSGFIGPNNHLPSANRRLYRTCSDIHPIHKNVADKLGIPELANYPGVNSEILDLLKLPEFEDDEHMEKYLINDIAEHGRHQSIKHPILKKCLDLIAGINAEYGGNNYIRDRHNQLHSVVFEHGNIDVILKFFEIIPREWASKIFFQFLVSWPFEQLNHFFEELLARPDNDAAVRYFCDLESVASVPFFIIFGVPESYWIDSFSSLEPIVKLKHFMRFISLYSYRITPDQISRIKSFFINHPTFFSKNMTQELVKFFSVMSREPNSIEELSIGRRNKEFYATFAILQDAPEISNAIFAANPQLLDNVFEKILEAYQNEGLESIDKIRNLRGIKIFLAKSKEFVEKPNWSEMPYFVRNFVERLLNTYEIDHFSPHDAELKVFKFTGHLIDQQYSDFLPQQVSFYLPWTKKVRNAVFRHIQTQSLHVLRMLLFANGSEDLALCGHRLELSSSFLRAVQESEDFFQEISVWLKGERMVDLTPANVKVLNHPVDRLAKISFVSVRGESFLIDKAEQFEKLVYATPGKCELAGSGDIEDFLNDILEHENIDDDTIVDVHFYQKYRNFFKSWIQSEHWKKLSYIDNAEIYDYMEPEFPRRIRKIRLLRANRTVQEKTSMEIKQNDHMIESHQNQLD